MTAYLFGFGFAVFMAGIWVGLSVAEYMFKAITNPSRPTFITRASWGCHTCARDDGRAVIFYGPTLGIARAACNRHEAEMHAATP